MHFRGLWSRPLACALVVLSALVCSAQTPAAVRQAARKEIKAKIAAANIGVENPGALASYFASLQAGDPIHILMYGDSHTASDDWANAMRVAAQAKYGD